MKAGVVGRSKGTDKVDIIDAKNLSGGIMENIDDAIVFLKRNLRVRYEIKTAQRKNVLELPEDALREAVTNAVCHRDYFEKGARIMVEIFDDRVEVTNPGGAPKGITKKNFGTTSVARNPNIATMLHRADYIERMGTGIKRMAGAMEVMGLQPPIFQTEGYFFKVIFKREPLHHDINDVVNVVMDVVINDTNEKRDYSVAGEEAKREEQLPEMMCLMVLKTERPCLAAVPMTEEMVAKFSMP